MCIGHRDHMMNAVVVGISLIVWCDFWTETIMVKSLGCDKYCPVWHTVAGHACGYCLQVYLISTRPLANAHERLNSDVFLHQSECLLQWCCKCLHHLYSIFLVAPGIVFTWPGISLLRPTVSSDWKLVWVPIFLVLMWVYCWHSRFAKRYHIFQSFWPEGLP